MSFLHSTTPGNHELGLDPTTKRGSMYGPQTPTEGSMTKRQVKHPL